VQLERLLSYAANSKGSYVEAINRLKSQAESSGGEKIIVLLVDVLTVSSLWSFR
jgi:hypothetical protein